MKITTIEFFNHTFDFEKETIRQYTANIVINDKFIIQLNGNDESCNVSIPSPNEIYWDNQKDQKLAYENLNANEVMAILEWMGVENNYDWLNDNANEHY